MSTRSTSGPGAGRSFTSCSRTSDAAGVAPVGPHREGARGDGPYRQGDPSAAAPRVALPVQSDVPGLGQPVRRQRLAEVDEEAVTGDGEPGAAEEREQRGETTGRRTHRVDG